MTLAEVQSSLSTIKNSAAVATYENAKDNVGTSELGEDAFLQLMMVQLQNQDPLDPMDNSEFLSQQAMFTQVSSLQEINEKFDTYGEALISTNQFNQASQFVGKDITAIDPDNSENTITGQVDSVSYASDGSVSVVVDGKSIPISNISSVSNHVESAEEQEAALKEKSNNILDYILENPKLQQVSNQFISNLVSNLA